MAADPKTPKGSHGEKHGGWKRGPLPPDTWGWGGVVPTDDAELRQSGGFYFADFRGDKVIAKPDDDSAFTLKGADVAWYNNAIRFLPPAYERTAADESEGG